MKNKIALITGSATGLGNRAALDLAKNGVDIVLNYVHNTEKAKESSCFISDTYGVRSIAISADISHYEEVKNLVSLALSEMGKLIFSSIMQDHVSRN